MEPKRLLKVCKWGLIGEWDVQRLVAQIDDSLGLDFGRQPLNTAREIPGIETIVEFTWGA